MLNNFIVMYIYYLYIMMKPVNMSKTYLVSFRYYYSL